MARTSVDPVFLPWRAPAADPRTDAVARRWWRLVCALCVLPVTALLHNVVFFRPTCILNNFGDEYRWEVVASWLAHDPSLPLAAVVMAAVYAAGRRWGLVRGLVAPAFVTSLPYTLWIWDIPFSGRIICHLAHDNRVKLFAGVPLSSRIVLGVCALVYLAALRFVRPRRFAGSAGPAPADPAAQA